MTRPNCPKCDRLMHSNGETTAGNQRWKCPACGHTMTEGGQIRMAQGRPMTGAERYRLWAALNPEEAKRQNREKQRKRYDRIRKTIDWY